jgi:hypothetical protein
MPPDGAFLIFKSKLYFLSATRFSSALHFAISSAVISFIFLHNKARYLFLFYNFYGLGPTVMVNNAIAIYRIL